MLWKEKKEGNQGFLEFRIIWGLKFLKFGFFGFG